DLPAVIEALTAAYIVDPRDAETAAHLGFAHVWWVSESSRLDQRPATITDHVVLARKYFAEAVRLAPSDQRYRGFHAGQELAEGTIHGDEKLKRRGYFDLLDAVEGWPEFNLFTAGYIMSRQPYDDARFQQAVDYEWKNLDVCAEEKIDRRA